MMEKLGKGLIQYTLSYLKKIRMLGIIIQARTGSTRLPNKMILPFFNGRGIFETIVTRLKEAKLNLPIVLATTTNPVDIELEKIALKQGILCFKGNENNVLDRYIKASEEFDFEKIIRICADNPFLDLSALKAQIRAFTMNDVDYWCYALSNNTPTIKTHYGFWAEGVKIKALKNVAEATNEKRYQEHVTNYIYSHPKSFSIHYETINKTIEKEKNIRLTIDTQKDFELCKKIYNDIKLLKIPTTAIDVLDYVNNKQQYIKIMEGEIANNTK